MSNIIQPNYGARTYSVPTKAHETKRTGTQGSSFLDLAARASRGTADVYETSSHTENVEEASASRIEAYQKYLEMRFGGSITVQSVEKDQKSMDRLGAGSVGFGNVVIAPNILEQMANDPEKATYYESKIQHHFDSVPKLKAELSMMGHELHSCGVVIHPDGTVTEYVTGDLKPEVRARIEAKIKAEDEAKAKRKRAYQEQAEKAAEQRRAMLERIIETGTREKTFSSIGDLLKMRMVSVPTVTPDISLPAGTNMFFLNL